jgi:hypothetical protein
VKTTETGYTRLPGTGYRQLVPPWAMLLLFLVIGIFVLLLRGRRVQLWMGNDHLLVVEWTGSKEYYKRIQYSDVHWMSIQKTDDHIATNGVIATLMLVFTVVAALSPEFGMRIAFGIFAALGLLLLVANLIIGPTCKAFLGTAVQVEELVSLRRIRKARKVFDMLRPAIAAAQQSTEAAGTPHTLTASDPMAQQAPVMNPAP